jgi:phage terminase large subunit GpA-like protein
MTSLALIQPPKRGDDGHIDAKELVRRRLRTQIRPAPPMPPSQWAAENLIVPDGTRAGDAWSAEETPYIVEPLDLIGPDSPVNEIAVMKSAQTGFTTMLIAAVGHSIDRDPCRMMVIQPTDAALSDFNRDKLQPAIDGTKALKDKVIPQTSRSSTGSTTYSKRYAGGSLTMAIASSAADLRSKTIKKLFRDEIDEYPDDLDGQGDPLALSDGRLFAFLTQGDWKKVDISTPTIKGSSKIEQRYEEGDKRQWRVPCPHCDGEFSFEFGANFRHNPVYPFDAHYVAPCCGSIIHAHDKRSMVRKGRWVATDPRPGAFPSYHFDTLSSPFVPWDIIAAESIKSGDDPQKLKTFHNIWLGLPYEIRGDAPDYVRLMERREEGLKRGHIPPRGLVLVAAADVQMRGIWVEVIAIAPTRETWVVEQLYLDGSTEAPNSESFEQLEKRILNREWPDAFGRTRKIDALGVDSGYRSHVVYTWTRANQRLHPNNGRDVVLALKGVDGWGRPPIGTASLVDIDLDGKRVRRGARVWPVGTWPLKGSFYEDLRKEGLKSGRHADPEGYCHFPDWLDETYFRQITSEYLAEETFKGRSRKFWKLSSSERDNHLLDCRVYNLALAEHLGLWANTEDDWKGLAKERGLPEDQALELFRPRSAHAAVEDAGEESDGSSSSPAEILKQETLAQRYERLAKANMERF